MGNFGWADWSDFQMQGFFPALQTLEQRRSPQKKRGPFPLKYHKLSEKNNEKCKKVKEKNPKIQKLSKMAAGKPPQN